ncbi:WYL domain-containing protein, partial [bacterium]|nr:WYL domain-containing protein [bacterium]
KEIKYEKGKLYLVCFILKYKKNSIINFERIRKIFCINMNNASTDKDCFDATFKLLNNAVDEYIPEEGETIIEKGKDYIIIKARVNNEFKFIQRLLSFGCDFRIISPASLKAKVLEKLKLIQKGYE